MVRPVAILLFDLKVYGRHHIPAKGGVLIVSNHQSLLDPILLPLQLSRPLNYIAKSELFRIPFFAWFLRSILNAFPVRQGASDVRAVKETIQRLQEGHLMNIYPEGARTEDGEIAPLQRGVALIIERARVVVVPAVIVGAFEAWPIRRRFFRCRPVCIQFGPPMDLAGLDRDQVMEKVNQTLRTMFDALRSQIATGVTSRT
jgi:1-acyl-sn-glycerol-3-phosphate acyltransferase